MLARVYVRVSTDEQAREGFSLAAQEERCRQFAQSQGWTVDEVYRDDGYSAKDLNRPAIQRMIRDVKTKKFDVLIVYRLDRLVRSVIDLHYLLNIFDKFGVKFKSVTEVFDTTTAMGRFFITLVGAMSQWERENLSERVRMGMERGFLEGNRYGNIPFGYREENGKLVIDPNEAAIVRWIFEQYEHHGMHYIAHKLNDQGIKTRQGFKWGDQQVRYVLTNPVYIGHLRLRGQAQKELVLESQHEPIISEELFYDTQKRIKERREAQSAKAITSDYPFSGVLVCGRCGSPMVGAKQKMRSKSGGLLYYYRCNGRLARGTCDLPDMSERKVEKALFEKLHYIIQEVPPLKPPEPESLSNRIKEIEAEIERLKKRRRKWQEAFANDVITLRN
jgi:site-specific DNA recombinase